MSGEKRTYVSVEEQELRRLREQESRLRSVSQDLPERLNAIRNQIGQEMHNRLAPIEARQRQYENMVSGLQSDLGRMERQTQERLQRHHREFTASLQNQRGEYLRLFEEQDRKFTGMVAEERQQRQQAVERLQGQISALTADASRKKEIAISFMVDLSQIIAETDKLPHARFAPGQMDALQRHVEDAHQSMAAGMPEASLSTAQRAYWEMVDLRILVLQKEREFLLLHQAAIQEAREILEKARANRQMELEVGEGEGKDVLELEVDHWTRGELSEYEAEIKALENRLVTEESTLTIDQVKEILTQLEASKPRIGEIVEHARQSILSSQLRYNIAEMAVGALQKQGFMVDEATYEGDDQRNAYVVKVKNIAGSEVVTVVSPVAGEFGKNTVSVNSYDETFVDESTLRERAQQIVGTLKEEGLQVGTPECAGDAKPEYRDLAAVRQRQVAETAARR